MSWNFYNASGELQINDGGLSNIVEDTTPQLGGDLDANSSDITGVGHIGFLASQDASAGANDLDDYEEGTFSPTLIDDSADDESQSYARQLAHYTKIGRIVTVWFRLEVNGLGTLTTSQHGRMGGMPFTTLSAAGNKQPFHCGWLGSAALPNAYAMASGGVGSNTAICDTHLWDDTGGPTSFLISEMTVGIDMAWSGNIEV